MSENLIRRLYLIDCKYPQARDQMLPLDCLENHYSIYTLFPVMVTFKQPPNSSRRISPSYQSRYILRLTFLLLVTTSGLSNASTLRWYHSYSGALAEAGRSKKPIFLAFR